MPDQYLYSVLERYRSNVQNANVVKNTFSPVISEWAGHHLLDFDFSGSTSKGTSVNCSSDLDLFVSLSSNCPWSLSVMYDGLFTKLNSYTDVQARKQNVSVGIVWSGLSIDITPGQKHSGNTNYHSLFKNSMQTWTQTNIQRHINIVQGSNRINEIKLAKIWRHKHNLNWPSIYVELFVIDALRGFGQSSLSNNFLQVLNQIKDNILTKQFIDPSNTNNIISNDLTLLGKSLISSQAGQSLNARTWESVVW